MTEPILSSSELEALKDAVQEDVLPTGAPRLSPCVLLDGGDLPRFRFGESRVGGAQQEERLTHVFDQLCRDLETRVADVLQRPALVTLTFMEVGRYKEFRESFDIGNRSLAMIGYGIRGIPGSGMVCIEPELVERIVEARMGGAGLSEWLGGGRPGERSLSALDLRVLNRWLEAVLTDLGRAWNPSSPLELVSQSVGTGGVIAREFSDGERVIAASMEVEVDQTCLGLIGLVIPRASIDSLAGPTAQEVQSSERSSERQPLRDEVPGLELEVEVTLGSRQMSARDLLALGKGDILHLDRRQLAVCTVQGVPKMLGVPGNHEGHKALQIVQILERS